MDETSTIVELVPGVRWLAECYEVNGGHEHVSVYLVGEGPYVVVDTGSFHDRETLASAIEVATGGADLDAIILSHSDYPHAGNVRAFRDRWGEVELVASSGWPEAQGLPPEARKCEIGGSMDVAGREWSFIDPPLADRSHTTWIFDHGSGVLFTADGFGSRHEPGECRLRSVDLPGNVPYESIRRYHEETLPWLRYVDPEALRSALSAILEEFDPSYVAPVHGHPIAREDLEEYVDRLLEAAEETAEGSK